MLDVEAYARGVMERLQQSTSGADLIASLQIVDKAGQMVRYQPNRVQAHFAGNRSRRDVVLKARQLGLSTEIQASMFRKAITRASLQATLAHDDETTQKLRRMADRFWRGLPTGLQPERGLDNKTTTTYPRTGSEVTIVTAGNVHKGRGGTYTDVHGSEVAFWKDARQTMAGVLQGVSDEGAIVLESTPNGAQGYFYEQCMQALDGDPAWKLHFYPWWWDAGYTIAVTVDQAFELAATYTDAERALVDAHGLTTGQIVWRRGKQRELGMLFLQEYPEDPRTCFLLSGTGFFTGALDGVFSAPIDATPQEGRHYAGGLDFGQTDDYTVCSVLDVERNEQVHLMRLNRLPWDEMRYRIVRLCDQWKIAALLAEKNAMGPVIEQLYVDLPRHTTLIPFATTPISKPPLIAGLRIALAEGGLKLLPDADQRRELQAFQAHQSVTGHWQYGAPAGEHDDTVIALALAWHAARSGLTTGGIYLDDVLW
jgi:hypothetical protein